MSAIQETRALQMIPSTFSWKFSVMSGPEAVAEVVDRWWWLNKAELLVQGSTYRVYRDRPLSGAFRLESASTVLARAEKPSALRRLLVIEHSGRRYTLRAKSSLGRELLLFEGANHIGTLTPESIFTRRAIVVLPPEWTLPVRVFVMWLGAMLWKASES
jgi:hypothetical protein